MTPSSSGQQGLRGRILGESDHIMFLTRLTITIHLSERVSRGRGKAVKRTVVLPPISCYSGSKKPPMPLKRKGRMKGRSFPD
ncbi:hypothetical protein NQZ68_032706 [Dissostichus eleginoides]|nr:hypothetical protein NQZ68_032706 [Dissostichus eleginoides]